MINNPEMIKKLLDDLEQIPEKVIKPKRKNSLWLYYIYSKCF